MPPGNHHIIATDLTPAERDTLAEVLRESMKRAQVVKKLKEITPSERAICEDHQQHLANIMVKFRI